jgi:hypothetical protein
MTQLIDQLRSLRDLPFDDVTHAWPVWRCILIALAVLSLLAVVVFYIKIRKCTSKYRAVKVNEQTNNTGALAAYSTVHMSTLKADDKTLPLVASAPANQQPDLFINSMKTDLPSNPTLNNATGTQGTLSYNIRHLYPFLSTSNSN